MLWHGIVNEIDVLMLHHLVVVLTQCDLHPLEPHLEPTRNVIYKTIKYTYTTSLPK